MVEVPLKHENGAGPLNTLLVDDPFYPDYSDVLSQLHSLATDHPTIAHYQVLGQETHGSRDIVALKISDNVSDEEDEPTWAFNGFVHGSEQLGLRVLLDLAEELVTGYGSDTDITNWVDAYEIWIVILLNPWGYDHDSDGSSHLTGTRKNGANTGDVNTSGVDLARNYDFEWGDCGSTLPDERDFIGPAPFSEQETQAIRDSRPTGRSASPSRSILTRNRCAWAMRSRRLPTSLVVRGERSSPSWDGAFRPTSAPGRRGPSTRSSAMLLAMSRA